MTFGVSEHRSCSGSLFEIIFIGQYAARFFEIRNCAIFFYFPVFFLGNLCSLQILSKTCVFIREVCLGYFRVDFLQNFEQQLCFYIRNAFGLHSGGLMMEF